MNINLQVETQEGIGSSVYVRVLDKNLKQHV